MHTEYLVTAHTYIQGVAYERSFLEKEKAEIYATTMSKDKNIQKCVIETMNVGDYFDRFQLKPLKR